MKQSALALAVLVGAVSSYGLDVGGLRRLAEERFPVLAQLPLVGSGNVPPRLVNIFVKVGTTKIMITAMTSTAMLVTTAG